MRLAFFVLFHLLHPSLVLLKREGREACEVMVCLNLAAVNGVFNLETAAPWKLDEALYDEMTVLMIKIAKQIMHYDED